MLLQPSNMAKLPAAAAAANETVSQFCTHILNAIIFE
jgi:hypothetical protein